MQDSKHSAEVTSAGGEPCGETSLQVTQLLREQNLVLQLVA